MANHEHDSHKSFFSPRIEFLFQNNFLLLEYKKENDHVIFNIQTILPTTKLNALLLFCKLPEAAKSVGISDIGNDLQ